MPPGKNTIFFISKGTFLAGRPITYGIIVDKTQPQMAETYRNQLTLGGNLIDSPDDVTTPTSYLITVRIIFNSVLSTKN